MQSKMETLLARWGRAGWLEAGGLWGGVRGLCAVTAVTETPLLAASPCAHQPPRCSERVGSVRGFGAGIWVTASGSR